MASLRDEKVSSWLEAIAWPVASDYNNHAADLVYSSSPSTDPEQQVNCRRKRKRGFSDTELPSPPTSLSCLRLVSEPHHYIMAASPKKRKTATEDDTQLTPRAPTSKRHDDDTSSTGSLPYSESLSQASTRSPTKMLTFLQLDPAGFDIRPVDLDNPDMPEASKQMFEEIDNIAASQQVVPAILKSQIDELKKSLRSYNTFRDYVFTNVEGEDTTVSPERLLEDVLKTVDVAQECQLMEHDETGWNHLVHTPLLDTILDRQSRNITGFVPCMSASILPEWRLQPKLGTRVDYAIVINPEHDSRQDVQPALERLQSTLPEGSANHTGFAPLRHRPISVSIETKRYGGHERKAEFQLGMWHSAQWKLLAEQAGEGIEQLALIPGIIIQGHDWKLVVSTNKEGKTRLWASRPFGSTQTPLGTFQVIAGVRRLAAWSREEFWPWYKTHMLRLLPEGELNPLSTIVIPSDSQPSG